MLQCDIIGDPANYPTSWKVAGNQLFGNPLLVGEGGNSLIPDGTSKAFKMSRKVKSYKLALVSNDLGATWAVGTPSFWNVIEGTSNSITSDQPTGRIIMLFYTTEASPMELASNAEVLALGDVYVSAATHTNYGGLLVTHLLDKVATSIVGPHNLTGTPITSYGLKPPSNIMNDAADKAPAHTLLVPGDTDSPTVKVLPYLTREDGKAYLRLLYKEMIYDVDWGDDSKFNVIDNESTTTDDNANTVKIGQKRIELPFFVGDTA
jgi:hypothetical protein